MAPVVRGLAALPEDDVRAIAHYLVSLQAEAPMAAAASGESLIARSRDGEGLRGPSAAHVRARAARVIMTAMAPELVGLNQPLALNPNLHSVRPDNLLRAIFDGIQDPAFIEIGHMPAFRHALTDAQISELAAYMRQRFRPNQPPWSGLAAAVARSRTQ